MNIVHDLFAVRRDTWPAYVLGLLAVGLLSEILCDLTNVPEPTSRLFRRGAIAAALFGVAWIWVRARSNRMFRPRHAPEVKGLVVCLGPNPTPTFMAIDHHAGSLQACWLVHSRHPGPAQALEEIEKRYRRDGGEQIRFFLVDAGERAASDPDVVCEVVEREVFGRLRKGRDLQLSDNEVVINLTPGHSIMTAGMFLAGLPSERRLEYNPPEFDEQGRVQAYPAGDFRMGEMPHVPDYGRPTEICVDEYLPAIARLWR